MALKRHLNNEKGEELVFQSPLEAREENVAKKKEKTICVRKRKLRFPTRLWVTT